MTQKFMYKENAEARSMRRSDAPDFVIPKKNRNTAVQTQKQKTVLLWMISLSLLVGMAGVLGWFALSADGGSSTIGNLSVVATGFDSINDDLTADVTVNIDGVPEGSARLWYALGTDSGIENGNAVDWILLDSSQVMFNLEEGNYIFSIKDSREILLTEQIIVDISSSIDVVLEQASLVLPVGGSANFTVLVTEEKRLVESFLWESSNEDVVTVNDDGVLLAVAPGEATITVFTKYGTEAAGSVIVTDLFQQPSIDNGKPLISQYTYTEEENDLLDSVLANKIDVAGYETRAGTVAAARFLSLEFPYFIPYFFENGRLNDHDYHRYVDGEGRFYHIGLFLHESRFGQLEANYVGPAVWGESLYSVQTGYSSPNGLNCGGFITWCLLNAGFDVGDSGAGDFTDRDDDLCDLGERLPLTKELMLSGRVKVGDLLWVQGHIAMIIGFDEENIYVAESLERGLHVDTYERYDAFAAAGVYTHVILMDEVYGEEGKLTDYWA